MVVLAPAWYSPEAPCPLSLRLHQAPKTPQPSPPSRVIPTSWGCSQGDICWLPPVHAEPLALSGGTHRPLMSSMAGVAAGGGRESRSSCANAACTMTEPGSFPAPTAVARVPRRALSWKKGKKKEFHHPAISLLYTPCPSISRIHPMCTVPQLSHLCWLVGGHAPAQLEALPTGLRGPGSW